MSTGARFNGRNAAVALYFNLPYASDLVLAGSDMTRSQTVKAFYRVLKEALGPDVSAGDVLRAAATLLAAFEAPEFEEVDRRQGPREGFFASEVDTAMEDGGWQVLDFELRSGMPLLDEQPENAPVVRRGIERLVGRTEWPRIEMAWL